MRALKLFIGLLLLPVCALLARVVYRLLQVMTEASLETGTREVTWLAVGFLLWVCVYLFSQPARTYILGHELTHVLWAWLTGIRVRGMRVGRDDGHVELDGVNFLVLLAPYFFPLYCMLVVAAYSLSVIFVDLSAWQPLWLGLMGLTYAFHVTFTIQALSQRQTDVTENGHLFSYAVIVLMNLALVSLAIVIAAEPTLDQFFQFLNEESVRAADWVDRRFLAPRLPPGA